MNEWGVPGTECERAQEKQAFSERKITFRNCTYYGGVLYIDKAGKVKPAAALASRRTFWTL